MASTDAKPFPQKNVAYRVTFPIFDNDGDLVTGAAGLDSEVSKDGAAFADCTNEATEIGSSGIYYLDLTSTEMNADTVAVIVKTSTTDAKTTPMVMYPEEAGDIRVNVAQVGGTTQTAGDLAALITTVDDLVDTELAAVKTVVDSILVDTAEIGAAGAGLTALATQASVNTIDDFLDTEIAAIKAKTDNLPTDPADQSAVEAAITAATSPLATAANLATVAGYIDTEVASILAAVDTEVAAIKTVTDQFVFGTANRVNAQVYGVETAAITAGSIATDAIGAAELAADAVTEIQSGLATAAALTIVDDFLDTEIAALTSELAKVPKSDGVVTWNATAAAQIQSEATDALNAYDPPTRAEATSDANSILTAVGDVPTNAELATALGTADDATLAAIAALSIPTAAAVADAVWDEDATAHQTQGTFGQAIGDPGADTDTIFALVNTNLNATVGSRASQTSVDDLPTNAELATALGTADDAVLTAIDALPTNAELATALGTADDAVLAAIAALNNLSQADIRTALGMATANLDTQLAALAAYIDTEVAAIKAKTDNLPASPANEATLTTIAGYIDTEIAAIKAKTDNLPTDPADASDIAASFVSIASTLSTLSAYVDTEVAAIKAKTDSLTFTVANQLDANIQYVNDVAVSGTGASGDEWGPV